MFPLHESTQRWVCRMAFAMVCVLPSTSLLAYALWLKTPLHLHLQANDFSLQTGTSISLDELTYPTPGVTRLHNVALNHAQTGEQLVQVRELEIYRDGDSVVVHVAQPQLAATQFDELWRQFQQQLLQKSFPACRSMQLIARDVTVSDDQSSAQTYSSVNANYDANGEQRTLDLAYQLAGHDAQQPATLNVVRQGDTSSSIQWNTGETELPIEPWTKQFPWLKSLGDDCSFRGVITLEQAAGESSGSMAGTLRHVDLNCLVSDSFGHKLSGQAEVQVHSARFAADRLVELHAGVHAGPGVIGSKLLTAAAKEWKLQSASDNSTAKSLLKYNQLACEVRLHDGHLRLQGACEGPANDSLIVLHDESSWSTPASAAHDPATLIRILSGTDAANVPATESTRHLIRWLPLSCEATTKDVDRPTVHLRPSEL